ncbi:MAG: hypothetical protein H0U27_02845 [Nitrosopumilus sp.]|nr:hypothetical protein [Nitrosopumilus sp.]
MKVRIKLFLKIILISCSTMPCNIWAQGVNNLWMMGYGGISPPPMLGGIDMDFITGAPVISSTFREMEF